MEPPIEYIPDFFPGEPGRAFMETIVRETPWEQREFKMGARLIRQPRLVAWFGDQGISYRYSGITHEAHPWTPELLRLRDQVMERSGARFNGVLVNFYRDGRDSVGWHADDERELGPDPIIASLSFGSVRVFQFRHKSTRKRLDLPLAHGSLLVMRPPCQRDWSHCIPKTKRPVDSRLNLTFRWVFG